MTDEPGEIPSLPFPETAATPPPPPPQPATPIADDKTMVIVVYALYLLAFMTGPITPIIGVVLAYVMRESAGERARSHYTFQIWTFWLSLLGMGIALAAVVVSIPLVFLLIGIPMLVASGLFFTAVSVWYVVRCVVGLIAAAGDQPYPRPTTWMV